MLDKVSIDEPLPKKASSCNATGLPCNATGLPEGTLRFALAAAECYPPDGTKGHRRIISADSVMDPFSAEWAAFAQKPPPLPPLPPLPPPTQSTDGERCKIVCLLDLPDNVLISLAGAPCHLAEIESLGATCRRTRRLLLSEAQRCSLLAKVGCASVASLRDTPALRWHASEITDDDVQVLVAWLERMRTPLQPLRALYLNDNLIGDRGLSALLSCGALNRLRHLSLASNRLTDTGAKQLIAALMPTGALPQLRELNLRGNLLTEPVQVEVRGMHDQNKMFVAL